MLLGVLALLLSDEPDDVELLAAPEPLEELELLLEEDDPDELEPLPFDDELLDELYKSAYQPPPLRINPAPPET